MTRRRSTRLNVREESTSVLRAARETFGPIELFADLVAEIDWELCLRELPIIAEQLGAFLVVAPAEVA